MYPTISEYLEAIKAAEDNFEQLKHLRPVLDDDGQPVISSGGFAVVFKMKDENTGKLHAVKCFLKDQEGRAEAYREIAEELEYVSSTFLTPIKYLDKELFVDTSNSDESEFPVLLMDWVEGQTLDKYICEHIDNQYELSLLAYQFSRLAMWLMPQPFAHGDLKPDNILVKEDGTLVLVDYDGMYVPAMKGQKARELGSPDFRHPGRTEEVFDDHIDDFSLASILLSLKAISLQSSLLEEYGASDRLLFSEKDYRNLSESSALGALQPLMQDAELASLYSLYILALSQNNLSQVSFRLFNLSRPDKSQYEEENLSTEVTKEDLANAWTDEFGVMYSKDKKRLLRATREIKEEYFILKDTCVICDYAFSEKVRYCNSTVIINNSVIKIGKYSFFHCPSFYIYKLPEKLEEIGDYAFCGTGIIHLTIPQSVVSIGNYAFANCTYLETIAVSDKVPCCGENAFTGCSRLSTIFIPIGKRDRIELIFPYFNRKYYEMKLHNIESTYANEVDWTAIWTDEFGVKYSSDKKRLLKAPEDIEEYAIKEGTRVICDDAFNECKSLRKVVFSDDIEYIGKNSFNSCKQLSNLNIPENLISIGDDAFYGCESLTSIEIPSKVEKIGEHPLRYCSKMKSISVNPKNTEFDSRDNCNAIINTKTNTLVIGCSSTIIPVSVTSIGCDAFTGCFGLTNISLPNSIAFIGEFAFSECTNLVNIFIPIGARRKYEKLLPECKDKLVEQYDEENLSTEVTDEDLANAWTDEFGVKYSADKKRLLMAPKEIAKYTIIEGTTIICNSAFERCSLTSVTIPNSIKVIGKNAFQGCFDLAAIELPDDLFIIADYAFNMCHSVQSLILPSSVKYIGCGAFRDMRGLSSLRVDENNKYFDSRNDCDAIVRTKDNVLIRGCSNTVIPSTVSCIGDSAFSGCDTLCSITIPNNINILGKYAFEDCELLSSIEIPDGIVTIEDYAFDSCYSLKTISLPNSISKIGSMSFNECGVLSQIFVQKGTKLKFEELLHNYIDKIVEQDEDEILSTEVTDGDFENAWVDEFGAEYSEDRKRLLRVPLTIEKYSIKSGTKVICDYAFCEMDSEGIIKGGDIMHISIPDSVLKIGKSSFAMCNSLKQVKIPSFVNEICDNAFCGCEGLIDVTISDCVSRIGNWAFAYCNQLKSFVIPKSVVHLGSNPFRGCDQLEIINCKSDKFVIEGGSLLSIDKKNLISCLSKEANYNIPKGVTSIENGAFSLCGRLTNISIPDTVRKIGDFAFSGCISLQSISIPFSVTHIGIQAFFNCETLTQIKIPNSIVHIGDGAFGACDSLKQIIVSKGNKDRVGEMLPQWCWYKIIEE